MVKRTGGFGLVLSSRDPKTPAYRWLYTALRGAIVQGQLRPGARLPSTRDLAAEYGLSRGTIVSAFAQLYAEGYVHGAVGSGTYVNAVVPDDMLQVAARGQAAPAVRPTAGRNISDYARRLLGFPILEIRPTRAFRSNLPALDQFPTALWAQIASRRLRRASTHVLMSCPTTGYPPLRRAIADYLATSRGVNCHPEQVMIVSGVQEALDLIARLVLNPGDPVCMEDPGYRGAFSVFAAMGARIAFAPVDEEGMEIRPSLLRGAKLVYLTPAHQYPLGATMSLARRLALLEWTRRTGALVFEDDYDSEYRYSGQPIPALQGLDRAGQVVFAGTFNKALFPSLRLGYLVAPPDLVDRLGAARSLIGRHLPFLEQSVVCDFIADGHFGRHLRRMRQLYGERLSVLTECARRQLAGLVELSPIAAGLHTIGWLDRGISGEAATEAARAHNVETVPLRRFYRGPMPRDGVQIGFAAVNPREIRRGVADLAPALEAAARNAAGSGRDAKRGPAARPSTVRTRRRRGN